MFEKILTADLKKLFDLDKVSFNTPADDAEEQEALFVEVEKLHPRVGGGEQRCRVEGKLRIFVNSEKMPFGYFMQCLAERPEISKKFFFGPEINGAGRIQNIDERTMDFIYKYSGQYDPDQGLITSLTVSEVSE